MIPAIRYCVHCTCMPVTYTFHCCYSNAKRMPIDVIDTLKEIVSECTNSQVNSEEYIKSMETNRRLQLETWA